MANPETDYERKFENLIDATVAMSVIDDDDKLFEAMQQTVRIARPPTEHFPEDTER